MILQGSVGLRGPKGEQGAVRTKGLRGVLGEDGLPGYPGAKVWQSLMKKLLKKHFNL